MLQEISNGSFHNYLEERCMYITIQSIHNKLSIEKKSLCFYMTKTGSTIFREIFHKKCVKEKKQNIKCTINIPRSTGNLSCIFKKYLNNYVLDKDN